MRVSLAPGKVEVFDGDSEDWTVNLIDTGLMTNTGGRVKRLRPWLDGSTFMMTYGDGVSTIDLEKLYAFHRKADRIATVTAVRPPARFGGIDLDGHLVSEFAEKSQVREGWINGGYLVFEPAVFEYIEGDQTIMEMDVLNVLAKEGQLAAYRHDGFWQCMDTMRDKLYLQSLWDTGAPPWKMWE
jgi:glucose-1-phosphate cytidylyltransferase